MDSSFPTSGSKVFFSPLLALLLTSSGTWAARAAPDGSGTVLVSDQAPASRNDEDRLHQMAWSRNGIQRREALRQLAAMGEASWHLPSLLKPLRDIRPDDQHVALVNLLTGLDPASVARPSRMTDLLLARVKGGDRESRLWGVYGLGLLLETRFSISSYQASAPTLLSLLKDADPTMRQRAAEALGRFSPVPIAEGDERLRPPVLPELGQAMVRCAEDPYPEVRAACLQGLKNLALLNALFGFTPRALEPDRLADSGRRSLGDVESSVRLAAIELLAAIPGDNLPPPQRTSLYQGVLAGVADRNGGVVEAALTALARLTARAWGDDAAGWPSREQLSADLAEMLGSGRLTPEQQAKVLAHPIADEIITTPSGKARLADLGLSPSLGVRLHVVRLLRRDQPEVLRQGLVAADPLTRLAAIQVVTARLEKENPTGDSPQRSQEWLEMLGAAMGDPVPAVRWAAALAAGTIEPARGDVLQVLKDLLETASDDALRENAHVILERSRSPQAADVLMATADPEMVAAPYVRSCTPECPGIPQGQHGRVAARLDRAPCRQVWASCLAFTDQGALPATADALLKHLTAGDDEVRFAAAFVLGSLSAPEKPMPTPLREKVVSALRTLADDSNQAPDVRRIAATMLERVPKPVCPHPIGPRMMPGFAFDPWEGRCLYDTRTGCGAGLSEIFSSLRRLLHQPRSR